MPLDKQPGYAILDSDQFFMAESLALTPSLYEPICDSSINIQSALAEYRAIAKRVGALSPEGPDNKLVRAINSTTSDGFFVSPLGISIKSHKPQGSVSVRCIHKGISPCWNGLSRWVVHVLSPLIASMSWLIPDSQTAVSRLKACVVNPTDKLATVDLKDFFLSGSASEVAVGVGAMVDVSLRVVFIQAVYFLLDNQYVYCLYCSPNPPRTTVLKV